MFGKKEQKAVKLIKKDIECCQCWKKIASVYVKPEEEENFKDTYAMCPECFVELCDEARNERLKNVKKEN